VVRLLDCIACTMKLSQEQINSVALRFKEAEWDVLSHLSKEEMSALEDGRPEEYDPSSYTHYGEFFLTISGIKPCFLITNANYPQFGELFYFRVLKPLLSELPGFELFRVQHPCSPSRGRGCPQIVYIFTSRYHPKFPLIEELLMKPQCGPIPAELLGKALGYPVPGGESTFCYVDQTTTQELGVSCVVVFEFTAREGFERSIKMHFEKCAAEFRKLGKVLTITRQ
jgi:hypothetical protein